MEKDWTKLPGYFKKKASSPIASVDEFIRIVRSQKIIKKFFAANDPNFAGIRAMLDVFYGKIRSIMCDDPAMAGDIDTGQAGKNITLRRTVAEQPVGC